MAAFEEAREAQGSTYSFVPLCSLDSPVLAGTHPSLQQALREWKRGYSPSIPPGLGVPHPGGRLAYLKGIEPVQPVARGAQQILRRCPPAQDILRYHAVFGHRVTPFRLVVETYWKAHNGLLLKSSVLHHRLGLYRPLLGTICSAIIVATIAEGVCSHSMPWRTIC